MRLLVFYLSPGLVPICEINRIHHWCSVGTEKSQPEGPPFQWETRLAEFPTERWTRGLEFFWNHWTPMIDSFSHIPRPYGKYCVIFVGDVTEIDVYSQWRALYKATWNSERTAHWTINKWLFHQNGFTRTSLSAYSATVTRVSNFVEENMCVYVVFYIVKAPRSGHRCQSRNAQHNRLNMSIAMHSACSKHWIKVVSKNAQFYFYTKLKADLNR